MNAEPEIVKALVERKKAVDSVASLILFNRNCKADSPTKEAFWKYLVLSLLTTQQRSTKGSAVDLFETQTPFPMELQNYESMRSDEEVCACFKGFRFAKPVARYLRINHSRLFEKEILWTRFQSSLAQLEQQRNGGPPDPSHKVLERKVARQLAGHLKGIGPKQSRNLLQWLGLTRYETPLDSRVAGWLGDNLGWNIPLDSLIDHEGYEFWLDRLQSVCEAAGVLPTVFDAAAFEEGKAPRAQQNPATRIGYVNKNGQVVVRNTDLRNPDKNRALYMLGCSYCGQIYCACGSDIAQHKCPKCQGGAPARPYDGGGE
jgi:hypothetical protein